jgi:uncharacterized membrane protein
MTIERRKNWLVPAGLIALSVVPIAAGIVRLVELRRGVVTAENARFFAAPAPVVLHVISITLFSVLGALQFAPRLRRTRPSWHRIAGRIAVPAGLIAAGSGLWMSQFYALPANDGRLLHVFRWAVGVAMILSLVLGYLAIRRRDVVRHQAWMLRGYALGMGAGTQVLTNVPWVLLRGAPDTFARAMLMGAGWAINVAVAEWIIRRGATAPIRLTQRVSPATAP